MLEEESRENSREGYLRRLAQNAEIVDVKLLEDMLSSLKNLKETLIRTNMLSDSSVEEEIEIVEHAIEKRVK